MIFCENRLASRMGKSFMQTDGFFDKLFSILIHKIKYAAVEIEICILCGWQ